MVSIVNRDKHVRPIGCMSLVFVVVHMAWATRSRSRVLVPEKDGLIKALLNEGARREGSTLLAVGLAWDHVHIVARMGPRTCTSSLAQRLKGFSSHQINARGLMTRGLWWQAGYFAESVSSADVARVIRYVASQRANHDDSHPMELWLNESPTKSDFPEI